MSPTPHPYPARLQSRGGELRALKVREQLLSMQVQPLTAKSPQMKEKLS